jgi:hypothetical protein
MELLYLTRYSVTARRNDAYFEIPKTDQTKPFNEYTQALRAVYRTVDCLSCIKMEYKKEKTDWNDKDDEVVMNATIMKVFH